MLMADDDPMDSGALLGVALGLNHTASTLHAEAERVTQMSHRIFRLWQRAERTEADGQDVPEEGQPTVEHSGTHCYDPPDMASLHDEPPSKPA